MKTIKVIICNLLLVLTSLPIIAQESKTYKESFDVDQNAELVVKLSNADVNIETWSKNKIQVEATLSFKANNQKKADSLFKKYPIEILGNSSIVKISSYNDKHFSNSSLLKQRYDNIKKKRKKLVNRRKELLKKRKVIKKRRQEIIEKRNERLERLGERRIQFAERRKNFDERRKNAIERVKKANQRIEEGKKAREKIDSLRRKLHHADNEMNDDKITVTSKEDNQKKASDADSYLNNNQIDRKIVIKVPKDTKVNIKSNQSYMKIGNVAKLRADIAYSKLEIGKLVYNKHTIKSEFSEIVIEEIKNLDLNVRHAKNVELEKISFLNLKANASNLKIGKLEKEAIINGKLGELRIDEIGKDFELIDIDLKNSDATLNLPDIDYQFYGNMRSCRVDVEDQIGLSMRSSFDKVIYQNENQKSNRMININADFSRISLQ